MFLVEDEGDDEDEVDDDDVVDGDAVGAAPELDAVGPEVLVEAYLVELAQHLCTRLALCTNPRFMPFKDKSAEKRANVSGTKWPIPLSTIGAGSK